MRESPAKLIAISIAVIAVICYLGFKIPHILGKPALVVTFPMGNPYATNSNNVVIEGSTKNPDSIYVNGDEATITTNGSWQKNVLLQSGINTFDISAKKSLGGKTDVIEQIVYNPSISSSSPSSTIATTTVQ